MRLDGKAALVTGAARGIGLAFAEAYVREGARVAIADIDFGRAERSAAGLGDTAIAVRMDVADQESIEAAVADTIERLGRIDIPGQQRRSLHGRAHRRDPARRLPARLDINVGGTLFVLQAVARHMIARGGGGKIINMASQAGRRGEPLVAVYCATKAAVISITQSAGLDLIRHGINVNAIAPGVVDGEHWNDVDAFFAKYENKAPGQKKKDVGDAVPFGRMGRAEDLTGMAIFLATGEADYTVSQCFNVDGGQWMS